MLAVADLGLEIRWTHEYEFDRAALEQNASPAFLATLNLTVGRTVCEIKGNGNLQVEGVSWRSKKDAFDPVEGMRRSLDRAIARSFDREQRSKIWAAFNAVPKNAWLMTSEVRA